MTIKQHLVAINANNELIVTQDKETALTSKSARSIKTRKDAIEFVLEAHMLSAKPDSVNNYLEQQGVTLDDIYIYTDHHKIELRQQSDETWIATKKDIVRYMGIGAYPYMAIAEMKPMVTTLPEM